MRTRIASASASRRGRVAGALAVLLAAAVPAAPVGTVRSVEGEVMASVADGEPFGPVDAGTELHEGGVVVVMEDSTAVLDLAGKGPVTLADMASLKLEASASTGEYSTVTGVRAPVLFLYPTGTSADLAPGRVALTFGINHDLDKIRGVEAFQVMALHEDAEADLAGEGDAELLDAAKVIGEFAAKARTARADYTWYDLRSTEPLEGPGEYTLFVVGVRGGERVKLGQSTLVYVEDP